MLDIIKGLFSDPAEQLVKGVANKATGIDFKQTEEDFAPEVIDVLRDVVRKALLEGRKGTAYEDYPDLPDGTPMGEFVRSDEARGGFSNVLRQAGTNPAVQAALSIGRGSIKVEDGKVYLTDKYNFAKGGSNKGEDTYSKLRKAAGITLAEDSKDSSGNTIEIFLGKEDELVGRKVKKGDTLSEIAKDMGVSAQFLADYNGITNPNKLKVGQRIKRPPTPNNPVPSAYELTQRPEEQIVTNPKPSAYELSQRQQIDPIEQALTEVNRKGRSITKPANAELPVLKEYVVKAGDTLSKIAKANGTSVAQLVEDNNIIDPNMIKIGQVLIV